MVIREWNVYAFIVWNFLWLTICKLFFSIPWLFKKITLVIWFSIIYLYLLINYIKDIICRFLIFTYHLLITECLIFSYVLLFHLSSFFFFYCSGFCHTLKWNSHGFTCVPHPYTPSHLPLYPIPLGLPSAPGPSACLMHPTWAGNLFHPR